MYYIAQKIRKRIKHFESGIPRTAPRVLWVKEIEMEFTTKSNFDYTYEELKKVIEDEGCVFFTYKARGYLGPFNQKMVDWSKVSGGANMLYVLEKTGYVKVDWNHLVECVTPPKDRLFPDCSGDGGTPYYALRVEKIKELP